MDGNFCGEVFAHYYMGDVMMFLRDYRFVTDSMFIYSLPMWMKLPNGMALQINRDVSKFKTVNGQIRWPDVEKKGDVITISWFPMYFKNAPRYPIGFAAYLAHEFNIQAENVMYTVFRFNLNALLPIDFSLKGSENSYVQMVISGVERQLELIGGFKKFGLGKLYSEI